ncbi:hypothetical protein FF38_06224, partial [Lucilia cuprina]
VNFGSIITADASNDGDSDDSTKVVHFVEKPDEPLSSLVNGGVYLLSTNVFDLIAKAKANHLSKEAVYEDFDDDLLPIETEVLPQLADNGDLYVYTTIAFWRQVKEAPSALVANKLKLDQAAEETPELSTKGENIKGNVFIDSSAKIDPTAKIGPNVTIGPNVKIGPGARVRDSVILAKTVVKDDSVIIDSIICPNVKIGRWLGIDYLLTMCGISSPSSIYPPSTKEDLLKLIGTIENSTPTHSNPSNKFPTRSILYIFLDCAQEIEGIEKYFVEEMWIPNSEYSLVSSIWNLDQGNVKAALNLLGEPWVDNSTEFLHEYFVQAIYRSDLESVSSYMACFPELE